MHLLFVFFVLLFTLTRSSSVENEGDLPSVDIIAFGYSQQASQHWDCPQVSDRAEKAEETRIWRTVIPDARIKEWVIASESRALLQRAEQYKWIKGDMLSSNPFMHNSVLLGMRKPSLDGSAAPVKVLCSKNKQVNQNALSVMLPQLEQSKDGIMDWMARKQASLSIPRMTPKITDPLASHRFLVPPAVNYHPRVFRDAHFTTGDLVAWMALAAEARQKGHADALKFFKMMVHSFLPGFSVSLGAVPVSSAGRPTKTVYLHRSFQYIPAGADLAFYFDGNRGKFVSLQWDSIVLNRSEGIVDGQQHAALVLSSNADASSLEMHQIKAGIAMRKAFCEVLEKKAFDLHVPSEATDAEVQAIGVSTIRSLAARLEQDSFLEAQRKVLEVKPKLLTELLPEKLVVKLVIEYFSDDAYPFIVSAHNWKLKDRPRIAVDNVRLYVITESEGVKGLNQSLANLNENERRCIELGDSQWSDYSWFSSSHDGRYIFFSHKYKTLTIHDEQTEDGIKWFTQDSEFEDKGFKRVMFDGENSSWGLLSRDGQILYSYDRVNPITRVYQITEETGKSPTAFVKLELNGFPRVVSGKGNRVMIDKEMQFEIHDIGKGASKLVCQIDMTRYIYASALNEDGSEAAFFNGNDLRIMDVDKVVGNNADQPAIVTVIVPKSLGLISKLVYSDENKLHVLHFGGSVSLFDPSTKTCIPIEVPQKGQDIIHAAISPNADYIATIQRVGEEEKSGKTIYRTIVKRKLKRADWRDLFGYEADEAAKQSQA